MTRAKQIVLTSCFCAMGLVSFIIENMLPPLMPFAPGVKVGLSNIFILFAIIYVGVVGGFSVAIVKSIMGSLVTGNMSALLYSLPATVMSFIVMLVAYVVLYKKVSVIGISVLSSGVFNITQVLVCSLIMQNIAVLYYIPVVVGVGSVAGMFTGSVVFFTVKNINVKNLK